LNPGVLTLKKDQIILDLNLRYPVTAEGSSIYDAIQTSVDKYGVKAELIIDSKPLYFSVDDPFIRMLHKEYLIETGDHDSVPLVQGGGTYARTLKNAAAIGGKFPYNEDRAHQKDEYIFIKDLLSSARIYAGILIEMTS
jgi:succinyl-diaminopimelate desuccinylase